MGVRSKRLFGPVVTSTGATALYTCPAGETALLKYLSFQNPGAVANVGVVRIGANVPANTVAVVNVPAGGATSLVDQFIVLHPGDELRIAASLGTLNVSGHGAELEGVAD